ncbi:MAG: aminotransferase class V-fold PLP-dependent enzyme, partial [Clostridiales bacterium]|nr:aminotransferase class V-fold PLP-dependent enzyme [Clostridiales bacterium]
MVNFDNSATTFPKPSGVSNAVARGITEFGGNPGRSGHAISMKVSGAVYSVRSAAADFFGAEPENVVFTLNATMSLNMAIKGIMQKGGHIIISSMEHNAVGRPVHALYLKGVIDYSIADVSENDTQTVKNFEKLIKQDTKCICCTIASNVTGRILPYHQIAELCKKRGICFIVDAAQGAGILPLNLSDGFNFICTSGHKGLYGPTGTGLLISDGKYPLTTIIEGGTGATSAELKQTSFLPEQLESGTINTVGIMGLGESLKFVKRVGVNNIHTKEQKLCNLFIKNISKNRKIKIYRDSGNFAPIVSFNIENYSSYDVASILSDKGFALRGGLQCAAITHRFLGTTQSGIVRFSPGYFNTPQQVMRL